MDRLTDVLGVFWDKVTAWIETSIAMLPNLAAATVIVVGAWLAARLVSRVVGRLLQRATTNAQVVSLTASVAKLGVIAAGLFVALGVLHLEKTVTSLLAGVGILGLALGFAFQDLAANFMSGIVLSLEQPFRLDQIVETHGIMGTVVGMRLRSTTVRTFNGQLVEIPNKDVLTNPIINYSESGERRIDIPVGVSYGDDLETAAAAAREAVESIEERMQDRDVEVYFTGFGSSSIDFEVRFWLRYPGQNFLAARSEAYRRIKAAFGEAGVTIPFPIRTLDFGIKGGTTFDESIDASALCDGEPVGAASDREAKS